MLIYNSLPYALAKLTNIARQTLLFVRESLAMGKKVTPNLRWKQYCLTSNVDQFRQAFRLHKQKCYRETRQTEHPIWRSICGWKVCLIFYQNWQ